MKKHNILILDVEALGIENPLVYDIGYAITDRKGNIKVTRSFLVKEVFGNLDLMNTAYYANKLPLYYEKLNQGIIKIKKWYDIRKQILEDMEEYNINILSAYNLAYDSKALDYTMKELTNKKFRNFFPKKFQFEKLCIWALACQTIFTQKRFSKIAANEGWLTPKGNMLTNAEIAYRYLTKEYGFIEEHTGLADVLIENFIMAYCFRQNKKYKKMVNNPWKIPNKK